MRQGGCSLTYSVRTPPARANQQKTNLRAVSLRFTPVLWSPSDLEVRGSKKEKKKERKNNAKFSGHYVRPRTHAQRSFSHTSFVPI